MQPRPSKKARFNAPLVPLQIPPSVESPHQNQSSSAEKSGFFPSSPPLPQLNWDRPLPREKARQSSPIGSEGALNLLLAACQRAEEEEEAETREVAEQISEAEENEAFTHTVFSSENSLSENSSSEEGSSSEEDEDWEDDEAFPNPESSSKERSSLWIDSGNTSHAKEKLIRILAGEILIPKQRWSLRKILATLVYYRKDKRLSSAFRQLKSFAYQTMMIKSEDDKGRWPGSLTKKDCNIMIRLRFRREMEKRYGHEVQRLCRTSGFGLIRTNQPGDLDRKPLEAIVSQAKEIAPMIISLILGVGPTSTTPLTSHLASMKLLAILVIICRSAHQNNSNYFPLLVAMYLYSAGARVDAITLLNHLGISVSYNVLLRKLRSITTSSAAFIKEQASNRKLVGTWDNFEYRENVAGERIGDTVKFRSVTMALWIKNGWKIPATGLKQWMWDGKRDMIDPSVLVFDVFGPQGAQVRQQCVRSHRFRAFLAGFPSETLAYTSALMPVIDVINCKVEGKTEAYAFAPSMFSKSSLAGNQSVFEDLNVMQMGIDKTDCRWNDWLTIWWGDQKTEVQMLGMQANGIRMDRPYDRYQHIFPGLALWHLRFNYLKMIWELFYPGGSATERSTLQWAADHWHRDKTTRPTDFHSLEDLTLHSYRARVIAITKPWIQEQDPSLKLHDNKALGAWLSNLTPTKWTEAMEWLDCRMNEEATKPGEIWNDHWNNHIRFCQIVEPYMTLYYAIKNGDIGLLRHAMREICIILQAPAASKPKYARAMLRQVHIFDTKAADLILQEAYLANALVTPKGLPRTFYEMDLLLEHQNGEFKRFRADKSSSLQESDEMFRLHALSVDALRKVRSSMNRIVIGKQRDGYHPQKDASFDILSLADQLHRSKSTYPEGPERGKIYFSENQVPDLIKLGQAHLPKAVKAYKEAVWKDSVHIERAPDLEAEASNETV